MAQYNVVLLDRDGCETVNDVVDGMAAAKKRARYLMSESFAFDVGSTHETLGSYKTEVRAENGECLADFFL